MGTNAPDEFIIEQPINRLTSEEAFKNFKTSNTSQWPRRQAENNRFSGTAHPSFNPRFPLIQGEKIFTIGSCFARHVEFALHKNGMDIVTLKYHIPHAGLGESATNTLNNYNPLSIMSQIDWAFGKKEFDVDLHAYPLSEKRHLDMYLTNALPAVSKDEIIERRNAVSDVYRALSDCSMVIITLGLIEAWYDNKAELYLNVTPPKIAIRKDPDRFELHVLTFNQVKHSLIRILHRLQEVCLPNLRVLLTVSPVPITTTFTGSDVAVANMHSKSVLRAAAGEIVSSYDFVDYFPSYESIILTDRNDAYADDQVHINHPVVQDVMDRVVDAYFGADKREQANKLFNLLKSASQMLYSKNNKKCIEIAVSVMESDIASNMMKSKAVTLKCKAEIRSNLLEQAQESFASLKTLESEATARSYTLEAEIERARGNTEIAEELLLKALSIEKQSTNANHQLALLYLDKHKYASAEKYASLALKWSEDNLAGWRTLRDAYIGLKDYPQAADTQKIVIKLSPERLKEEAQAYLEEILKMTA